MGRHRRSAAGRAATSRATGVTETHGSYTSGYDPHDSYDWNDRADLSNRNDRFDWNPADGSTIGMAPYLHPEGPAEFHPNHQTHANHQVPADHGVREVRSNHEVPPKSEARLRAETRLKADTRLKSEAYLFATEEDYAVVFPEAAGASSRGDGARPGRGRRRKRKSVTPAVKSGLLGVSAAVAIGTVAVAAGAMPGLENYKLGGGGGSDKVQAAGSPSNSATEQGGTSGSAESRDDGSSTSRGANRPASPSAAPTKSATAPATKAPAKKPAATPTEEPTTKAPSAKPTTPTPTQSADAPVTVSAEAEAEAAVLKLVNEQRAIVGCSPVAANSALTELAENFSTQMATENFFDHTDPSGATPWDRAEKLGITNLGGENIARGQADAAAVMDAWMNSPGHKANILNCDFKTLGVGVHFGTDGPWWTQDFGY
ncbi:CAP domain-containing protein [Streptomyces prunicolor]|uniref:CAP domain-containing protein n=1 Tax=Streptomyces prunicolor TaxID=67348 RepID=UPI0022528A76|nr:CAP domain-containing protein [Streptomyces prunicolor]MCX5237926.1 CAP domain-containing protein [Streptomyces prunicolor]